MAEEQYTGEAQPAPGTGGDVYEAAAPPQYDQGAAQPTYDDAQYAAQPAAGGQQQQYDYNDNAAATPVPAPSGGGGATGLNGESLKRVATSTDGVLRLVQWFTSMIAFAATADVKDYDNSFFDGKFEFVVATGIIVWMYTTFQLAGYVMGWDVQFSWWAMVEAVNDALWAFLQFLAGALAAAECDRKIAGQALCSFNSDGDNLRAGAAFSFISSFLLMFSTYRSVRKWRASS